MAEVQLRALKVSAELDSSKYVAGARDVADASRTAGTAVTGLGTAVTQNDTKISQTTSSYERLKRTFIEGHAASRDLERSLQGVSRGLERGAFTADQAARAVDGIIRRYGVMADASQFAVKGQTDLARAIELSNEKLRQQASLPTATPVNPVGVANDNIVDRNAQYRRQNLSYQMFDVGQSAALGMSPAMIAMQQGPQIAQIYAAQGGLNAAMKDFMTILSGVARVAGPMIAILAGVYGAYKILSMNTAEARLQVSETTRALATQAAPVSAVEGAIAELAKIQKDYTAAVTASATAQDAASRSIVASSQREYEAKKALLELELKRQEASLALQQSEAAIAGLQLRKDVGAQNATDPGLVRNGFADPAINGGIPFVRVPDQFSGMEKLVTTIESSPAADKIKEINAQATLTQIAIEKLREGLKQVFTAGTGDPVPNFPNGVPIPSARPLDGPDEAASVTKTEKAYDQLVRSSNARIASLQNEISLVGQATSVQARLRAEFEAEAQYREQVARAGGVVDEREIAALKAKAAAVAQLTQQLAAANLIRDQNDQIQQLRLEAQLVGASADQRARATAALQAEQQLRQQGIDLLSKEGQLYKANAVAMAQARLEIERQNAAYSSLEQAGGSAINALTVGTGSLKDRLKSAADTMLQWVQQMTIANPLKNAMFGSNLPTMGDLFSGRTSVPGAQSTATMTVTAGTVMVNGGVTGALSGAFPSSPTGGSLSSVLGLPTPANSNIANGVRPDLMANGIVNSPVSGLTPTDPASRAMMWRQGISQIESGSYAGNYSALGPITRNGDRAYGRYQVMGNNVPSWSEKYYGERLNPQQYLANTKAQDAVFDGEFGSYVSKYGEGPAANKWFTGSHVARGATDVNGMSDNRYSTQFTSNMQKLSQTTASTSKDLGTLGDTSSKVGTQITDGLGKLATPAAVPAVPAPATATSGSNPFASLFGGFFKLLGFADGTDYSPGGSFMVGERGREIVNLPRGSQVVPNHKMNMALGKNFEGMGGRTKVDVGVTVDDDGKLKAYVKSISEETSIATTSAGISAYDTELPNRIESYRQNPYNRGGF